METLQTPAPHALEPPPRGQNNNEEASVNMHRVCECDATDWCHYSHRRSCGHLLIPASKEICVHNDTKL